MKTYNGKTGKMFQTVLLCPLISQNSILHPNYDIYIAHLTFCLGHHSLSKLNDVFKRPKVLKFVSISEGVGQRCLPNCHNLCFIILSEN